MDVNNVSELLVDMGVGWNLGNTFDMTVDNPDRSDLYNLARSTPTSQGTVTTQLIFFDALKNLGFNSIRFPVTWYNHIDETTDDVDVEYLDYIDSFVDHIVNTLGMYCIIDMHHDERFWFNADTAVTGSEELTKYEKVWTDIATYFADYSEKLIFQGYNEILDTAENWDNAGATPLSNVNVIAQSFVDTVRAIEGNQNRYLCISSYAAKPYSLSSLVLPDNKCFADVHIYTTDVDSIKYTIDTLAATNKDFIIGEFGIKATEYNSEPIVASQSFLITYAKTKGAACFLWDDYGTMQFLKRNIVTDSNYTSQSVFNGYLIDAPNTIIEAATIKNVSLYLENRKDDLEINEIVRVYPDMVLDKTIYIYSSDSSYVEKYDSSHIKGIDEGTAIVTVYGPYGVISEKEINVVDEVENYFTTDYMSLQDINNWDVKLTRTIPVLNSANYIFDVPSGVEITVEELTESNNLVLTTVATSKLELKTSLITTKLKITIELTDNSKKYSDFRQKFGSNYIDMTILFDKMISDTITPINEEGLYYPKLVTRDSKLIVSSEVESNVVVCAGVETSQTNFVLDIGDDAVNLSSITTLTPSNTNQIVRYSVNDPSIVNVDLNGNLTPLNVGESDVSIICGATSKTLTATVSGVVLSSNVLDFNGSSTKTLTASIYPATEDSVVWTSSDTGVATVANGVITPVSDGNAIITATYNSYSANCSIEVTNLITKTLIDYVTGDSVVSLLESFDSTHTKVELDADMLSDSEYYLHLGAVDSSMSRLEFYENGSNGNLSISYGWDSGSELAMGTGRKTFTQDKNVLTIRENDLVTATHSCSMQTFVTEAKLKVQPKFMNVYGVKIWSDTTLIRDFVPVKDLSNVACLYDNINKVFVYPTSGTLTGV